MLDLLPTAIARLLDLCFSLWPSYGATIVLATAVILALLTPLSVHGLRRQQASAAQLRALRPELDRIRSAHADDAAARNRETAAFLASHDVSPLSTVNGCWQLALQSPVFMAVFHVIRGLGRVTDGVADPRYLSTASAMRDAIVADNGRLLSLGLDLTTSPATAIAAGVGTAIPALVLVGLLLAVGLANAACTRTDATGSSPAMWVAVLIAPAFALVMPAGVGIYSLVAATWRLAQQQLVPRTQPA